MNNPIVIIPSLNPDDKLIKYCEELISATGFDIVLVDDGSDENYKYIFNTLKKFDKIIILEHYINMGKGRALKDAFNFCLSKYGENNFCGVITVDSDGQHCIKDVIRLANELKHNSSNLILGVRDFNKENVPSKSRFGNKITRFVFKYLHGINLSDTQTGLRAIPSSILSKYLTINGEKFEYETNMLIVTAINNINITEIEIETLYENHNEGTHFNPIKDSIAIYKILFSTFIKYTFASFSSFILDIAIFQFMLMLTIGMIESDKIIISTVMARIISSLYNYTINKNVVFYNNDKTENTLIKYILLVIIQMSCSAGLVFLGYNLIKLPESVIKIIVDTCLFIISYKIQKKYIF